MNTEEFAALQSLYEESGHTLKRFLQETGMSYSTYHYWEKIHTDPRHASDDADSNYRSQ